MPVGPFVRRLFGPYERQVANLYRRLFIDLDDWIACIAAWVPQAHSVLEIGCGEGAMTERLVAHYSRAHVTAIDITPRLGRLYRADPGRVTFRQAPVEDIASEQPQEFELVVLSDVVHHVPPHLRESLLTSARAALAPGGSFVFKEWIRTPTPAHWLCEASDRFLTGDKVSYLDAAEARALLCKAFEGAMVRDTRTIRPWRNNMAFLLRSPP